MSLQTISDRKIRKINADTGIEFVRVRKWNNYHWVGVTDQHVHYTIQVGPTGYTAKLEDPPVCWTSCREHFDFAPYEPGEYT